jgi:predicted permease
MSIWQQDFSYTFRRLGRSPGFAAAVILSIGLGIAANATIFSMVSRFVLRPASVGDPATLLALHTTHEGGECCNNFPQPVFEDVRDKTKSFSGVSAYNELVPASVGGSGEPERVWGQAASANFFDVLELPMTAGRGFLKQEENQQVIVISHRLWQRRFASDPNIAGKLVNVSGHPYTVVGVTPAGFRGVDLILDSEFWVPLGNVTSLVPNLTNSTSRDTHWLQVVARLKPGVTRTQADAELSSLAKHLAIAYPATDKGNGFLSDPAGSLPPRDKSTVLVFLSALSVVVFLVLAIACANVANLMISRAASRQREMAVRIALGATRMRIIRQMVLESVLLALAGGVLGTLLSKWATRALATFHFPAPVPINLTLSIDWRVLVYAFLLSVGAGLFFGIVPAWAASRPRLADALKGEDVLARPGRKITMRNLLIVGQVSMCLVLLTATGLFLRSLQQAANIDIGFRSNGIVSAQVDPRVNGYSAERTVQFLTQLRQNIAAQPGVISAVVTDSVPLSGGNRSDGFRAQVKPKSSASKPSDPEPIVEMYMATPGYFEALGIPRIAGRDFSNESSPGSKVAIVNRTFVDKIFGSDNPIGQSVVDGDHTYQIIGVVENIKSRSLGEDARPVLFRSLDQAVMDDPAFMGYTVMVRSAGRPADVVATVRNQIRALDPLMAVYNVQTMQEHLRDAFFLPRLGAALFGIFGAIGLVLAAVGLYGAVSYSVSKRTREIGIRMALGAQAASVQRLFVRQGMMLTLIAVAIGIPASFALARLFASVLYGVHTNDPATFAAVPLFLALIALIACWLPARRASRVDPQTALRSE